MEAEDLDRYRTVYGDDYVDITERVQCYDKGKAFSCDCGQDFGVTHERTAIECVQCGRYCVDTKSGERGPPEREEGQQALTNWT